jgi:hypothetical protein
VERALAIADQIGSNYLRAYAVEALTWRVFEQGLCEAEPMGERLVRSAGSLNNRVEAHESLCVAAICFARAGRFDRARRTAARTTAQAAHLSPHRALHAGASQAIALVPPGRFAELLAATETIVPLAEEEGPRICATGLVALAGRALALFEAGRDRDTRRPMELLEEHMFAAVELRTYGHPIAELLRPVLGPDGIRRLIRPPDHDEGAGGEVSRPRALLPVVAAGGSDRELEGAIAAARSLARPACAPALACFADWAAAAAGARAGRCADALRGGVQATATLARLGERYTADRLLAELLPHIPGDAAAREAGLAARRLAASGARASANMLVSRERASNQRQEAATRPS